MDNKLKTLMINCMSKEQLVEIIEKIEGRNQLLLNRLHMSKRDNRNNRDKLRKQLKQVQEIRMTDEQILDLDYHLAKVILPLLKRFRKIDTNSCPANLTFEKWQEILDKIIWSFNEVSNNVPNCPNGDREEIINYYHRLQEGFNLFGKWYAHLWG